MKIRRIRALEGPSVFHHRPVLSMLLDLGEAHDQRSDAMPRFVAALLAALPGLRAHRCSPGRPGGFVERLARGTYLGHIVEHVALALSVPAGIGVGYGKTVGTNDPRVAQVVVRYRCEAGMRHLLESAVQLVDDLLAERPVAADNIVAQARRIVARHALGPSTRAIVDAASARGIPWRRIGSGNLFRFGWGARIQWAQTAVSGRTSLIAAEIAKDKELAKQLLREAQIAVPGGAVVQSAGEAMAAMQRLPLPVVVKPLSGNHGRGCTLGVTSPAEAAAAYTRAAAIDHRVLVEEQLHGRDYRVTIVDGELVAASERVPAHVVGDGNSSVAQLIEHENRNPLRGEGHAQPLTRITIDDSLIAVLCSRGIGLESVPAASERVLLRDTANLSTGGTASDVTERVHPDIAALCVRAASIIGLDICGIDFISPDIGRGDVGAIIEINAGPGLRMHQHPSAGAPRDVGKSIVEMLYPVGDDGRIPLVAITGTNGKTTVTRMVGHVLASTGRTVGMACTDGVWIGERQVVHGDSAGANSARAVLAERSVEVAVVEAARGGILRRGLGYDWADVGVVTNVHEDHVGQDGIRSVNDLLRIKALVAARVRAGGTIVLNADNEPSARIASLPQVRGAGKRIVYTSLHADHLRIRRHLADGHTAFFVQGGWIVEASGLAQQQRVVSLAALPVGLGGLAEFNVGNAITAAAACRALGVEIEALAAALASFERNPGRANLYRVRGGYVLLDYGHNTQAYQAIGGMTSRLAGYRCTGVIDMPGDRTDALIRAGARAAAGAFHRIVLHKPHNSRGREPGAVATLICDEVRANAPEVECLIEEDEPSAIERALSDIGPGQFVVLFYERIDFATQALARHGAVGASRVASRLDAQHERRWRACDRSEPERRRAA